jgi:hypothetical protein
MKKNVHAPLYTIHVQRVLVGLILIERDWIAGLTSHSVAMRFTIDDLHVYVVFILR